MKYTQEKIITDKKIFSEMQKKELSYRILQKLCGIDASYLQRIMTEQVITTEKHYKKIKKAINTY